MEWVEVEVEVEVEWIVALVQEAVVLQIARSVELCHIWIEVCFLWGEGLSKGYSHHQVCEVFLLVYKGFDNPSFNLNMCSLYHTCWEQRPK